ncbi:unnamed protein product [Periconia digitata]|uniref:Uncharacterized protein n=1 Tax=Periconia digitata TaxID=1303443 RepID=A0A9W4XSX9_9PLEO|nr:unnamed protein product [Periconia digitata]
MWLLTLQFCIQNQRHPSSAEEDAKNKPWRPISSGRITPSTATDLLTVVFLVTSLISYSLGVFPHYAVFTYLAVYHNDFGGSDAHGVIRNALNAAGFVCFFSGALKVVIGAGNPLSPMVHQWIGFFALALLTTIHAQDFRDVEGDELRERSTITTLVGESSARWILSVMTVFWSLFLPRWIGVEFCGGTIVAGSGCSVALMTVKGLGQRNAWLDSVMYRAYNVWLLGLCLLPLGLLT